MRIAVVSDVHGSFAALDAVIRDLQSASPDVVIAGGDLALSGPRPGDVVDRIRDLGWPGVVGNTDELLWAPERLGELEVRMPKLRRLLRVMFEDLAPVTSSLLGDARIAYLRALPGEVTSEDVTVMHASPGDLWLAPPASAPDETLEAVYGSPNRRIVVYGHIHRPFVRQVGELIVVNSGSAGLSYDGDTRASYALIEDGKASIRRVEYDLEKDVRDLLRSAVPHAEWLAEIRRRGAFVQPPP